MTMLSSSSPVTATTTSGGRLMPARSSTKSSVASPVLHLVLELRLERLEAVAALLDQRHLVAGRGAASARGSRRPCRRLRSGGTSLDRAIAARPRRRARRRSASSIALEVGQTRSQAARAVELGARRVEDRGRPCSRSPNRFCAIWPITMFVLSPSVATTTASASSMPASRRSVVSMPWPTMNPPAQSSPSRPSASSLLVDDVPPSPLAASSIATVEPTRPQPMTITFTRFSVARCRARSCRRRLLVEHALRERDDQHLARGLPEHVVDRRREEARLAPPARRRAEHDQVGAAPLAPARRSPAPIERARTVLSLDLDAVLRAEQLRLRERGRGALLLVEQLGVERAARAARGSRAAPRPRRRAPGRA